MKGKAFSEEQIVALLQRVDAGQKVMDACREHGISEQTYYRWKAKYGGMPANELKRLRDLEQENARRKRLLADAMLDNVALKEVLAKTWYRPCCVATRFHICTCRMGFRNDGRVACSQRTVPVCATRRAVPTTHRSVTACVNVPMSGHALAISVCMGSYSGKGSDLTTQRYIACSVKTA